MILLLLFVLGASVGSFLNVCIWRLPRGESVVEPPSHCPHCNTRLQPIDLIPLVSQLAVGGKCRYCGARFSWRYFGIEFLTGFLFVLAGAQSGNMGEGGFLAPFIGDPVRLARDLVFVSTLVVVFFVDYDTRLIQLESVFLLGLAGVGFEFYQIYQGLSPISDGGILAPLLPSNLPGSILAMVITAGFLWMVREVASWLYGREAMGLGDVILVAAIAANLGWHAVLFTFFFFSAILGLIVGVSLQIPRAIRAFRWAKNRARRYNSRDFSKILLCRSLRRIMPFGPMLATGAVVALFYGAAINVAYLRYIDPSWVPETPF